VGRHQPTGGAADALRQSVQDVLGPVVEGLGLVVEDVVVSPAGGRRLLRVVLDAVDDDAPSLSLDAVADASREISAALDTDDVMQGAYVLEVTSPGVDRPLTEPRHFRRNLRRKVEVTLHDGSQVTGRVVDATAALTLSVEGAKKGTTASRVLAWDDVVRGQVQVEFKRLDRDPGESTDESTDESADESTDESTDESGE
jgi:ribosome maturation factor RimP